MTYGYCMPCDRNFDDLEAHKSTKMHKGHETIQDKELNSGLRECKRCKNMIVTPRRKDGKWEDIPYHKADAAIPIKNEQGQVYKWVNSSGVDLSSYKTTIYPEPEATTEGKTGCVSPT